MTNEELIEVNGGASSYTSATFLNAIARGIDACYTIGRACGTAIRMLFSQKRCS